MTIPDADESRARWAPDLNAALATVQSTLPTVAKTKTANIPGKNGGNGYSYTYADLADITDAILPLLSANGIAWVCLPRATANGYELVGTLRHVSGQCVEGALPLWGRQAQELGSSITYARRYLLGCMTGVVTEDDDDGARAAARPERTAAYNGPSTAELLARVDAYAQELGVTYEEVTAKFRAEHGNLSLDDLDAMIPERVAHLESALSAWVAKKRAEASAEAETTTETAPETADPTDPGDPWAAPSAGTP